MASSLLSPLAKRTLRFATDRRRTAACCASGMHSFTSAQGFAVAELSLRRVANRSLVTSTRRAAFGRSADDSDGKCNISIPFHLVDFSYMRSSGPGGQNVNKLDTKVQLRFNVDSALWLNDAQKKQLKVQQKNRISTRGDFILTNQENRSQHQNKKAVMCHLIEIVTEASRTPKERNMWTTIGGKAKKNRRNLKMRQSRKKSMRRKKAADF